MKILWYADFEGDGKQLAEHDRILREICDEIGGSFDGPYYPQSASLLYIFDAPSYEWLNESGRRWFKRVQEAGLDVTPERYEIAVPPEEFWGTEETAQQTLATG